MAVLYQLEKSQWLDTEELGALQLRQLRHVLVHARKTVPHYQSVFKESGIHRLPEKLDNSILQELPILTRDITQAAEKKLFSNNIPGDHGRVDHKSSSGSTGAPVKFLNTELVRFYWRVFAIRDHFWQKRDFSRRIAVIRRGPKNKGLPPDGFSQNDWGPPNYKTVASGPAYYLNINSPLEDQATWLQKKNPEYLLSFPSNIDALVDYMTANNIVLEKLCEVLTVGETVTENLRKKVRQEWNVPVKDIYTCEEAGYIAIQCPENDHYHVQSENVLVEIVDENGKPCNVGEPGNVLITTLHNFAMPLIRYELGDIAEWGNPCSCGRRLPVLSKIFGRKRNRLVLPDGRREFPHLGEYDEFEKITGQLPKQFQFIQKSTELIELKLVVDKPLTAAQEAAYTRNIQENFRHPFNVVYSYPDTIPKQANGKFEEFISEVE